jgi:carbonic anhydrase/acetyltransferase-like protein (isoleucine patch superfamily)
MKKYQFVKDDTVEVDGHTLTRIQALVPVRKGVRIGTLGGYIESESNLSHEGECWVGGLARVWDDARVDGEAWVKSEASVFEKAQVGGCAIVCGSAKVCGDALIGGEATVSGSALVTDTAVVNGAAKVCGSAEILRSAFIHGAFVGDSAIVAGSTYLTEDMTLGAHALIESEHDFISVPWPGTQGMTIFRTSDLHLATTLDGVLIGSPKQLLSYLAKTGDAHYDAAKRLVDVAYSYIKGVRRP